MCRLQRTAAQTFAEHTWSPACVHTPCSLALSHTSQVVRTRSSRYRVLACQLPNVTYESITVRYWLGRSRLGVRILIATHVHAHPVHHVAAQRTKQPDTLRLHICRALQTIGCMYTRPASVNWYTRVHALIASYYFVRVATLPHALKARRETNSFHNEYQ